MKKKTLRKLFAITLAGAMAMGTFAGCGGSEEPASNDANTESAGAAGTESAGAESTESAGDAATDAVAGIDGWTAFDETVTLKIGTYDRGAEGIDPVTDNGYTKYVQEQFGDAYNIQLEFVPITRSDVMTDYALLAASDDLPTVLMEYDYPKVCQWANDGYLQTIDLDAFAQVAPTYYNRMVELGQLQYTDVNDETYFCFAERPYYDTTYTFCTFVRMDWLEQVGIQEVPKSYEEYCTAMDKIIEAGICEHPAPGGDNGAMITAAYVGNFGFRDYPVDEAEWAQYSSLGTPSFTWEPTYKLLKRANAEYNAGYTNPEYFTTDSETAKANFINGKSFSYGGYMTASVDWLTSFYEANPDAKLAIASNYQGVEEGVMDFPQIRADNPYGMTIGFGNNATEDELKAAWMYMEWATLNIEELQSHADDWNNFNNSKDFWCITIESVKLPTIEESVAAIAPQGLPQDFTQEMIDNYYELREIADAGHAYTDPAFGVVIESESEYNATLLSLYIEYYDTLVMCDPAEFDAKYQEFCEEYLAAGYQEILDERLEAYNAGNTTKLPF